VIQADKQSSYSLSTVSIQASSLEKRLPKSFTESLIPSRTMLGAPLAADKAGKRSKRTRKISMVSLRVHLPSVSLACFPGPLAFIT
jgi:hypothetical protein